MSYYNRCILRKKKKQIHQIPHHKRRIAAWEFRRDDGRSTVCRRQTAPHRRRRRCCCWYKSRWDRQEVQSRRSRWSTADANDWPAQRVMQSPTIHRPGLTDRTVTPAPPAVVLFSWTGTKTRTKITELSCSTRTRTKTKSDFINYDWIYIIKADMFVCLSVCSV